MSAQVQESQLDLFLLLFAAKPPVTPTIACMLFMALFWVAAVLGTGSMCAQLHSS